MDTLNAFTGIVRRAVDDYGMIEAGDRIAVGISGGKDSMVLLAAMKLMKKQGSMVVRNVNETVMEVFEVTGFADLLTIE